MPEQEGSRHLPPTASPIEAPFKTETLRYGLGGLDLRTAPDHKNPVVAFDRFTNVVHENDGELSQRPGLTEITTIAEDIHSIVRMNDPAEGDYTRLVGAGSELHMGTTSLTEIDDGYSTDPLTFVPYRPPLSGDPWVFIGDSVRPRKVRADGLVKTIGLTAPTDELAVSPFAVQSTSVLEFDATDGSQASAWTGNAGFDYDEEGPNPTLVPVTTDGGGIDGNTVEFKAQPGAATGLPSFDSAKGYYSFWGMPLVRDLSMVGSQPASDDDLFHIWVKFSHPELIAEVRMYLVIDEVFSPSVLPGTAFTAVNQEFYLKTWRGSDIAQFIMANQSQITAAETARVRAIRDESLKTRTVEDDRDSWQVRREQTDPDRSISLQASAAREQWLEYGIIGVPCRRGEFLRIGSSTDRGWNTITGVVIYLQTIDGVGGEVAVSFDDCYLYGGYGPDSSEPGAQPYDWRYTHFDTETGAKSNPSEIQATFTDLARNAMTLTPVAYGDSAVRQRFFRRGGALIDDWYYVGQNESDGAAFNDTETDDAIIGAGTLETDNDAFVTSVNAAGDAILEQPLPIIFGPVQDLLLALGDPNRPGDVYFCKPNQPDCWPARNHVEVCSPGEELMNGGIYAGQAFVFSRERYYELLPNTDSGRLTLTALPSQCRKGLSHRWAMAIGRGAIWFLSDDGIYRTLGGPEERISEPINPLFNGQTVGPYLPIDLTSVSEPRLEIHNHDLHFLYTDTEGDHQHLIYSIIYNYWRFYAYEDQVPRVIYADEGDVATSPLVGVEGGGLFMLQGTDDAGTAIVGNVRTANSDLGAPREDKLLGDIYIDLDRQETDVVLTTLLNHAVVENAGASIDTGTGRQRYILDPFGIVPQRARTVALDLEWESETGGPIIYQGGVAVILEPDVTGERVTQWDDLGSPDEKYLTGCWIECDTMNTARTIIVEGDLGGVRTTIATLTVTANGRHRLPFSWSVAKTNMVRIRPDDECKFWILYKLDWISQPEPPRIAKWDINYENNWDNYLTGLDLDCDTFGLDKTVEIYHDQTLLETVTVNRNGRGVVHLTVQPPVRGHLLRFVATDNNPGLLYAHRWHVDPEPSEQTNWNQNFTIAGTRADKWVKGIIFECDTFGQDKQVEIQIDGTTVTTLTVNSDGRGVKQFSFPERRGRVLRVLPVDNFPSRLYSHQWIFDTEPLCLGRWETQEIDHDYHLWEVPVYGQISIRSTSDVTLSLTTFDQSGGSVVKTYVIPSTEGEKIKRFVPFQATKGVLFKYVFTCPDAFWLYREESSVRVMLWGTSQTNLYRPFGNDDLDATRGMTDASLAAARPGGTL